MAQYDQGSTIRLYRDPDWDIADGANPLITPLVSTSAADDSFTVYGDFERACAEGTLIELTGVNAGMYTCRTAVYDGTNTVVTVEEDIATDTTGAGELVQGQVFFEFRWASLLPVPTDKGVIRKKDRLGKTHIIRPTTVGEIDTLTLDIHPGDALLRSNEGKTLREDLKDFAIDSDIEWTLFAREISFQQGSDYIEDQAYLVRLHLADNPEILRTLQKGQNDPDIQVRLQFTVIATGTFGDFTAMSSGVFV